MEWEDKVTRHELWGKGHKCLPSCTSILATAPCHSKLQRSKSKQTVQAEPCFFAVTSIPVSSSLVGASNGLCWPQLYCLPVVWKNEEIDIGQHIGTWHSLKVCHVMGTSQNCPKKKEYSSCTRFPDSESQRIVKCEGRCTFLSKSFCGFYFILL